MGMGMGGKDYGNVSSTSSHFPLNPLMSQSPLKRPRIGEEVTMPDASAPSQELPMRKMLKTSNTSEEAIEDNLSEISDDADDILNSVVSYCALKI